MKKLHEVEPYRYTYRLYNRENHQFVGEFVTPHEALDYLRNRADRNNRFDKLSDKLTHWVEPFPYKTKYGVTTYYYDVEGRWALVNNLGDLVPAKEAYEGYRPYRYRNNNTKYDYNCSRLVKTKDDGKKIKTNYARVMVPANSWGHWCREAYYDNPIRGCYRQINTYNEVRANAAHADEYGDEMIRGRRRGRNLPNAYDDPMCSAWDAEWSWKHHSKRRKQWIPK